MRRAAKLLGAGVGLALGGFLVAASGVVPIGAASGHWEVTSWLLHFSMRRSIATHSLGIETPPLDDEALVIRGAGHYETGCRPCHGGPADRSPRVPGAMTPQPPYLPLRIAEWEPRELHRIVDRGIKFTGMPAWPVRHREDEVWAVVAFLLRFPALDDRGYRRLALGEAPGEDGEPALGLAPVDRGDADPRTVDNCARCHGRDGAGRGGAAPRLAGQSREYLVRQLGAYADGRRPSGIMGPVAAVLSTEAIEDLARYYAGLPHDAPAAATEDGGDPDLRRRGERIAHHGIPERRVPSCADCHGPGTRPHTAYPRLAGQHRRILVEQLTLLRANRRGGSDFAPLMQPVVERLRPEDVEAVAAYYASLSAAPGPRRVTPGSDGSRVRVPVQGAKAPSDRRDAEAGPGPASDPRGPEE